MFCTFWGGHAELMELPRTLPSRWQRIGPVLTVTGREPRKSAPNTAIPLAFLAAVATKAPLAPSRGALRRALRGRRRSCVVPAARTGFLAFPESFVFGVATSAYQIEGAAAEGRGPSIWDTFSTAGHAKDGATGEVACDHYHLFKEDIRLMSSLKVKAYRFSISWSRLLPNGDAAEPPSEEGLRFYSELLDALLQAGIEPWVTLYHWDLPEALHAKGGWLSKEMIVKAFGDYARICFHHFGDRVKYWITLNEPWCSAVLGYNTGDHAPGYTEETDTACYVAGHHLLLAHAEAAQIYREEFAQQGGEVGISLNADWRQADSEREEDLEAARRAMEFSLGWFAEPIYLGDYPKCMRESCGDRLPSFSASEKKKLFQSSDFFGLNSYSGNMAKAPPRPFEGTGYWEDIGVEWWHTDHQWARTDMDWPVVPWSLREILLYVQDRYKPMGGIIVTENGCACEPDISAELDERPGALLPRPWDGVRRATSSDFEDPERVRFFRAHLSAVHAAIERKAQVKGYFAWSFLDNFEWAEGYGKRFGIVRVDFQTQERTIKSSGHFLARVFEANGLEAPAKEEQYPGRTF
ncbi:unnamed protein product [Durusdinium trenchii]|uniref:Beta-glucosidase n=1 Tax=Durusdinium trenchii TaxID=1381693 RepID=A0ABP0P0I8_9DINO